MIGTVPQIKVSLIPKGTKPKGERRPVIALAATSLTIHNTANTESSAMDERNWLVNPSNTEVASWHYAVDQTQAVLAIPENEVAWHAGDEDGNYTSLSIEVCESGDQSTVYKNAVGLAAYILKQHGWGIDKMRTHKSWSGKECPRKLLPIWDKFVSDVKETLNSMSNEKAINTGKVTAESLNVRTGPNSSNAVIDSLTKGVTVSIYEQSGDWYRIGTGRWCSAQYVTVNTPTPVPTPVPQPSDEWDPTEGMKYLHNQGLLQDLDGWMKKKDQSASVWMTTTILANIHKDIMKKIGK